MVRLLIQRWYEPPPAGSLHLSTLVQQTLALIAERGGIRATAGWRLLCRDGPFVRVDQGCYASVLRCMAASDLITQMNDGTLLLGLAGERVVNHYSFFAVFCTPEEYRLVADGKELGSLPVTHPVYPGAFIIFAGRRWEVTEVDEPRKVICLIAAAAGKAPLFSGDGGEIHDRVRQEMLAVYRSGEVPAYLDERGAELLGEGRAAFREAGLASTSLIPSGRDVLVFPWRGDRVMGTLALQLVDQGFTVSQDGVALLVLGTGRDDVMAALRRMRAASPDPVALARRAANKVQHKYDEFLSEELLAMDFAARRLDVRGALASLEEIVA
jgi:ATP-dependent Lhr-like helicase